MRSVHIPSLHAQELSRVFGHYPDWHSPLVKNCTWQIGMKYENLVTELPAFAQLYMCMFVFNLL